MWSIVYALFGAVTFGLLTPFLVVGHLAYLAFFVWYFGGNMGHLVLGARVVNHRNGGPVSPGQSIGRAVASLLDWLIVPFLINWRWCCSDLTAAPVRPDHRGRL